MAWESLQQELSRIISSEAFTVGAAGAFFGALGAQIITSRNLAKERSIAELNCTNAATTLSIAICNRYLAIKRQHIKGLTDSFYKHREEYNKYLHTRALGQIPANTQFRFQADFEDIPAVDPPIEVLKHYVFEKVSIRHRAIGAAFSLATAVDDLNMTLRNRGALVEEIRKERWSGGDLINRYFGLPDGNGNIDRRYRALLEAMSEYTDQCIFFSKILAEDLHRYGLDYRKKRRWRFWQGLPELDEFSFEGAGDSLPDERNYSGWLQGFAKKKTRREFVTAFIRDKTRCVQSFTNNNILLVLRKADPQAAALACAIGLSILSFLVGTAFLFGLLTLSSSLALFGVCCIPASVTSLAILGLANPVHKI